MKSGHSRSHKGIFVNYSTQDSQASGALITDPLKQRFGELITGNCNKLILFEGLMVKYFKLDIINLFFYIASELNFLKLNFH